MHVGFGKYLIFIYSAFAYMCFTFNVQGYGKSQGPLSGGKADFLQSIMSSLKVTHPVLVSPSMSGGYSISFILKYPEGLSGYVPVAPVSTKDIVPKAQDLKVSEELNLWK